MDWWSLSYVVLWLVVLMEGAALLVLARAVGAIVLGSRDGIERDGIAIGKAAPDFRATTAAGKSVGLADLRSTYTALVFASPSCRICRALLPGLARLARQMNGSARIVIMLRGSPEDARLMQEDSGPDVEIWSIGLHGVAERFGARVSPYVQITDMSGLIRAKGLVNNIDHVEHLLHEAGVRHDTISHHATELLSTRG